MNSGLVPTKSKPPALRTVLRPPSHPTSQRPRKVLIRLDSGSPESPQAQWKRLQGRVRILGLLQHQHRATGQAQLTGEKQANRSGSGNYNIIDQAILHPADTTTIE